MRLLLLSIRWYVLPPVIPPYVGHTHPRRTWQRPIGSPCVFARPHTPRSSGGSPGGFIMSDPLKSAFCATDAALPVSPTPPRPKCLRGRIKFLFLMPTSTGSVTHNRRILDRRGASVIAHHAQISITHAGGFETRPRRWTKGFSELLAVRRQNGARPIEEDSS